MSALANSRTSVGGEFCSPQELLQSELREAEGALGRARGLRASSDDTYRLEVSLHPKDAWTNRGISSPVLDQALSIAACNQSQNLIAETQLILKSRVDHLRAALEAIGE
jgi:hypothetical protein